MIFCPVCEAPTLSTEISAMSSNRCDHCQGLYFLIYEDGELQTIHFEGNTQVMRGARCLESHAFRYVEEKFLGVFHHTVQRAFPTCEHCDGERESEWKLCKACQQVLGISQADGDRVLDGLEPGMEKEIRAEFPWLKHLLRVK